MQNQKSRNIQTTSDRTQTRVDPLGRCSLPSPAYVGHSAWPHTLLVTFSFYPESCHFGHLAHSLGFPKMSTLSISNRGEGIKRWAGVPASIPRDMLCIPQRPRYPCQHPSFPTLHLKPNLLLPTVPMGVPPRRKKYFLLLKEGL